MATDNGLLLAPNVIADALSSFGVAGASVAVLQPTGDGDAAVRTQVGGLASRETATPVFDSTWFEIASLSKPFAAVFAYQYFAQRGVSFDASVNALLAEAGSPYRLVAAEGCPAVWADEVTLTHLVDHTGPQMHYVNGIPRSHDFPPALALISGMTDAPAPYGYAPLFVSKRPGTVFGYSGGGFLILQHLLETRERASMAELMDRHLAACGTACALGLSFAHETPAKHYADGYRDDLSRVDGGRLNFPPLAAGALGTPAALLDWLRQLAVAYQRPRGCGDISHAAARLVLARRPDLGSEAFMAAGMGVGMFVFDVASTDAQRPNRWMLHQAANDGFRGVTPPPRSLSLPHCDLLPIASWSPLIVSKLLGSASPLQVLLVCFDGPDADGGPRGLVVLVNGDNQGMLCLTDSSLTPH